MYIYIYIIKMSVPIKYRDSVIYNNEVYTVFSTTTKSDNVNIKHNKNGNTITVKKYQVRKLNNNKYDIVEYNNSFYRIVDFTTINYQNSNKVSYELQEYDKKKIEYPWMKMIKKLLLYQMNIKKNCHPFCLLLKNIIQL